MTVMRTSLTVLIAIFGLAVALALHNSHAGQRVDFAPPIQAGNVQTPAKEEQPTFIQEGQMTDRQREHSKIFKNYGDVTHGRKIRDLSLSGDVKLLRERGSEILTASSYLSLNDYLRLFACHADAV